MTDLLYDTLKGVALATVHTTAVNIGLSYMDVLMRDKIVSGTHLTSINVLQVVAAVTAVSALMEFNADTLIEGSTSFAYELAMTYQLLPVLGSKFENIQSFFIHEFMNFVMPSSGSDSDDEE